MPCPKGFIKNNKIHTDNNYNCKLETIPDLKESTDLPTGLLPLNDPTRYPLISC